MFLRRGSNLLDHFRHCTDFPVLGFDCEWVTVNNERRKVALIQLCSPQGLCALIRVCKFSKIPLELRKILEDPEIIKAGVTPNADAKLLMEDYSINMNGTFDLRFLAVLTHHRDDATGLGRLSKSILGIELDKDWRLRCSDWEIETLSQKQIEYSAYDAYVAVEIFRKLYSIARPTSFDPDSVRRFCDNYTDITFKNKLAQLNLDPATPSKKLLKAKR
jgi:exonuclease 3'-5' domain-containing protein 2